MYINDMVSRGQDSHFRVLRFFERAFTDLLMIKLGNSECKGIWNIGQLVRFLNYH